MPKLPKNIYIRIFLTSNIFILANENSLWPWNLTPWQFLTIFCPNFLFNLISSDLFSHSQDLTPCDIIHLLGLPPKNPAQIIIYGYWCVLTEKKIQKISFLLIFVTQENLETKVFFFCFWHKKGNCNKSKAESDSCNPYLNLLCLLILLKLKVHFLQISKISNMSFG